MENFGTRTESMQWEKIENIEHLPAEQVYDIEVEGTHNFIGNDIVAHNTYITGGLGIGNATTTDSNIELAGKLVAAGNINGAGHITVTGSGTSTFTGGIYANALRVNESGCSVLRTDTDGGVVCGTVGGAGGITSFTVAGDSGSNQTISDQNTLTLIGGSNITSTGVDTDIMRFDLDSTLYSMGDIFATSSGASVYASSTLQATGNILGYGSLGIGTTSPARTFSLNGKAFFDSSEIRYGSSSASALTFSYQKSATSTVAELAGAWTIATSTNAQQKPIFSVNGSTGSVRVGHGQLLLR